MKVRVFNRHTAILHPDHHTSLVPGENAIDSEVVERWHDNATVREWVDRGLLDMRPFGSDPPHVESPPGIPPSPDVVPPPAAPLPPLDKKKRGDEPTKS